MFTNLICIDCSQRATELFSRRARVIISFMFVTSAHDCRGFFSGKGALLKFANVIEMAA